MDKEPFYLSTRFWVAVITPIAAALLEVGAKYLPVLSELTPEQVTAIVASLVVMAVTYITARTVRNTPTK